jgi:hypothetical protein
MMMVPDAANLPPPWQTEILAPGICAGRCRASCAYSPAAGVFQTLAESRGDGPIALSLAACRRVQADRFGAWEHLGSCDPRAARS